MRNNTAGAAEGREHRSIVKLLVDDSGQGLVEYAVILSAGLTVMMAALSLFAGNASATITAAAHDFSDAFEFQSYQ